MNTTPPSGSETDWRRRDLDVLWHPCTQMRDHDGPGQPAIALLPIARGDGVWLHGFDGTRYLDAVSSWWTNLFGHANARIAAAVKDQLDRLEQVMFAGFTHAPAIELAEQLLRVAPAGLARVFYADNGSSAVEVALKMSFHYWRNREQPQKTRFIALTGSYHGETLGALSVTDVALYRDTYAPLLLQPILVRSPDCTATGTDCREDGESWRDYSLRRLQDMRSALEQHSAQVSAVIIEPLVQCAAGMRMYDAAYLTGLRALCDEFKVHLIADEIAVGFGRTGSLFACEHANITPDFLCLSKGLTGGFMPLSAVLTTADMYAAFYAEYTSGKAFLHSHSYTGNPLACRAALATLSIFHDEPVIERNRVLATHMAARLAPLNDHKHVAGLRQTGMIAAFDMLHDKSKHLSFASSERRGLLAYQHALSRGVVLRPLGDTLYFMPPYVISEEEIDLMIDVARDSVDFAVR